MFVVKPTPIIIVPSDLPPPRASAESLPAIPPPSPATTLPAAETSPIVAGAEPAETDPPPSSASARATSRWPVRVLLLLVIVGGEIGLAHRTGMLDLPSDYAGARAMFTTAMRMRPVEPAAAAIAPLSPAEDPGSPGAPSTSGAATTEATSSNVPPDMGWITATNAKAGHRIFVDDRAVGETPESVLVKCGTSTVKIGSAGPPRAITIPCGGAVDVASP